MYVKQNGPAGFDCSRAGNIPQCFYMTETIQWPSGEFTVQAAVDLNSTLTEAVVRKKLSAAMAAKAIAQTQKGDKKIKGKFKVVK
jgi:hypothetical protein